MTVGANSLRRKPTWQGWIRCPRIRKKVTAEFRKA